MIILAATKRRPCCIAHDNVMPSRKSLLFQSAVSTLFAFFDKINILQVL